MQTKNMVAGGVVAFALVILAGCNSSYDDFCSSEVKCTGGNDKDKQACIDASEADEKEANDYGCSSEFSSVKSCLISNAGCTNGVYTTTSCSDQQSSLSTCEQGASGVKGTQSGTATGG